MRRRLGIWILASTFGGGGIGSVACSSFGEAPSATDASAPDAPAVPSDAATDAVAVGDLCAGFVDDSPTGLEATCQGVSRQLASDPKNCGRCDRVCPGPCDRGLCREEKVADVPEGVVIGADTDEVYVLRRNDRTVLAYSVAGGVPRTVVPSSNANPDFQHGRVDGNLVVLVAPDGVYSVPSDGSEPPRMRVEGTAFDREVVALSTANVYVGLTSGITKAPRADLDSGTDYRAGLVDVRGLSVSADDRDVFWVADGVLTRVDPSGQQPLFALPSGRALEIDDAFLYFLDVAPGRRALRRLERKATQDSSVALVTLEASDYDGLSNLRTLVVAPPWVYFVVNDGGGSFAALHRVHRCGGKSMPLSPLFVPRGFAIVGDYLYYSSGSDLVRVRR